MCYEGNGEKLENRGLIEEKIRTHDQLGVDVRGKEEEMSKIILK
jgi:hypothetical protein